jgi:hypothetical protein
MSTEFSAQGSIELTPHGTASALVQAIMTRSGKVPLANFEDVHAELHGQSLRLDVYGTSFSCHDQLQTAVSKLARFAVRPFAIAGATEGDGFTWYFGPNRRETTAFELTSKATAVAMQLKALKRRMTRNRDRRLARLQDAVGECAQTLQSAVKGCAVHIERTSVRAKV